MRSAAALLAAVIVLSLIVPVASAAPTAKSSITFIHDDYAKALGEAKAKKLPLFVEAWATWCHSCRSMGAYVFPDPKLAKYAPKFVWVALDIDKAQNASAKKKFVIEGVPSFFIVDPADETVALRWLGSATVAQLGDLLDDGSRAVAKKGEERIGKALASADRLYAAGKNAEAATAFEQVLATAPKGWSRYGRTTESLMFALQSSAQYDKCVARGRTAYPQVTNTSSAMNVAALGLDCAVSLPKDDAKRGEAIARFEAIARETMDNPRVVVAADDRSGLYISMIGARSDAGDEAGAHAIAKEWAGFLEAEAAKAPTPEARAVFDSHRLSAYIELGEPERAIPMLEQSQRDFPEDYNPPARLAAAYKAMGKYDESIRYADLALTRAYGPRRLTIFVTKADAQAATDKAAASATLRGAISEAEALPDGQRNERTISSLKDRLARLESAAASPQ